MLYYWSERDHHLIEGLDYEVSKDYEKVEIIINTGPWGFEDKLENYKPILEGLVKSKPLMICQIQIRLLLEEIDL